MCARLSLFVSLGKSRQWDPWLQRPSCHSKSQSHLWHWAPRSYYLWTYVHHLPGWERGETRECGRGKHTDCVLLIVRTKKRSMNKTEMTWIKLKWAMIFLWRDFFLCNNNNKKRERGYNKHKGLYYWLRYFSLGNKRSFASLNFWVLHSSTLPGGNVPPCRMTRLDARLKRKHSLICLFLWCSCENQSYNSELFDFFAVLKKHVANPIWWGERIHQTHCPAIGVSKYSPVNAVQYSALSFIRSLCNHSVVLTGILRQEGTHPSEVHQSGLHRITSL